MVALAQQISSDPAPPPHTRIPDFPKQLEEVILKLLDKNPDMRHQTAAEVLIALTDLLPELPDVVPETL
ncbi:MAG: hypothetical protein GY809_25315 [Planctomycetes bacterium]|nr:hypothetical protein [Planctomycetota bacterium]